MQGVNSSGKILTYSTFSKAYGAMHSDKVYWTPDVAQQSRGEGKHLCRASRSFFDFRYKQLPFSRLKFLPGLQVKN